MHEQEGSQLGNHRKLNGGNEQKYFIKQTSKLRKITDKRWNLESVNGRRKWKTEELARRSK